MPRIGYALSTEEHSPAALVRNARSAEECGFEFALISDHFHPWIDRQGEAPFVWSVIGAIAEATDHLEIGTGVTCPLIRIHPAIVAQAAATTAALMPGRFFLGVGTGENLNEHVLGDAWPSGDVRLDMLAEAIEIMRTLWKGEPTSFHGDFYTVEDARIYTLPDEPIRLLVAAGKPGVAKLAGELGDGLISTAPDESLVEDFRAAGGADRPRIGQLTVCYAEDENKARRIAREWWPNAALGGDLGQELPLPRHYEQVVELVTEEQVAASVVCGPDPDRHREAISEFEDAGYDHVYVHQVGPDQESFFDFYRSEILPSHRPLATAGSKP